MLKRLVISASWARGAATHCSACGSPAPSPLFPPTATPRSVARSAADHNTNGPQLPRDAANSALVNATPCPCSVPTQRVLALLAPIKAKYSVTLSWGDLIVLAGTEAVRAGGANGVRFCPGRVDATDDGVEVQPPRTFDDP